MADSVYVPGPMIRGSDVSDAPRHSAVVRLTHWINTLSFIGLAISGAGILLAHPRFYWGETGGVGTPSLFDLPLPFMLGGPSGWGRYLHFQSAWLFVLNGSVYAVSSFANRHFRKNLVQYEALQQAAYLTVILGLSPLMIWTGLAMSPAVVSVFPAVVTVLGGHQSARTIHFFCAIALVIFVFGHVVMVWRGGFRKLVRAMIMGRDDL